MKLFILVIATTFLSTCSNYKEIVISKILEKELKVIKLGDTDVSDLELTLIFQKNEKNITGFSGCNNYFGTYFIDGDNVAFSKIEATKMYCSPNSINKNEKLFLNLLTTITNYSTSKNKTIKLLNKNKKAIIILKLAI